MECAFYFKGRSRIRGNLVQNEQSSRTDTAEAGGVAAVNRALQILAEIENAGGPVSLSEIARRTSLYKSTVLRLIESLQAAAYVARLEDGNFVLGPAILRLGMAYERSNPIRQQLAPVLQQLIQQGTESPSFHIRHGSTTRLCVLRINSLHSTLDRVSTGDILPLDRGAAGKVILAHTDANTVGPEWDHIRSGNAVISLGERDPGCAGMAIPVFSAGRHFLGALSVSGPRERFQPSDIERMRPILMKAGADLHAIFGGQCT
jgi:DNA-binding IclR family transcriptional regulator